ncbi:hypothetical protein FF1_007082 [Malus domestica]
MQLYRKTTAGSFLLTLTILTTLTYAHNITRLLAKHSEFSTFNHYLTLTHLAADINERTIITICAIDNSAISAFLSKHLSIYSIKNILSLHVFLDYFSAKKLHQITNGTALVATMFQATGNAPGSSGLINITDLKGGKVGFTPKDNDSTIPSHFIKAVKEVPYNISIIQISTVLPNQATEVPTPTLTELNIIGIMSGHDCKVFTDKLLANFDDFKTYDDNVDGWLTLFCLMDDVFKAFLPKFKNLIVAGKAAVLEYHGIRVYQSMSMLRSNNGLMNTLLCLGPFVNAETKFRLQSHQITLS